VNRSVLVFLALLVLALGLMCCRGAPSTNANRPDIIAAITSPVRPSDDEFAAATESWRWSVPERVHPLLITALGDVFVLTRDSKVYFLDTENGKFDIVADSFGEWQTLLRDPQNIASWFRPQFVQQLKQRYGSLKEPYVFSPTIPLVLSGKLTPDNYTPSRWDAHLHVMGQIHRQVKDLPPGTRITKIHVDSW
jgi:hypothetical protein